MLNRKKRDSVGHAALPSAIRRALRESEFVAISATGVILLSGSQFAIAEPPAPGELGEIVVTAQKRTQSLQDVPYNITAVSSDVLESVGPPSMNDLEQLVPGLMNVDMGPAERGNNNNFVLRGLRADPPGGAAVATAYNNLGASPVSTYYGEVPIFFQVPLDDVARVEVLRGPQGTLYGSGAEAGTIRFVPNRPVFGETSGEVSAEGSWSYASSDPNGNFHALLNLPLADKLALRVNVGENHIAGFIKAVDRVEENSSGVPIPAIPGDLSSTFVLGPVQKDTNSSDQWYGSSSLRWQPIDTLDVQVDYLHQHVSMADAQLSSDWPGGPFNTSSGTFPGAVLNTRPGCTWCTTAWIGEPYGNTTDLGDMVASLDVGLGTVTSASSYYESRQIQNTDDTGQWYGNPDTRDPNTSLFLPYFPYYGYPRLVAPFHGTEATSAFVEELRLVSNPGKIFDYTVGLYYQREHTSQYIDIYLQGQQAFLYSIGLPNPTPDGDLLYIRDNKSTFTDRAVFGELTFHLTSKWQVTGGLRVFRQSFQYYNELVLPLCGTLCADNDLGESVNAGAQTYTKHVSKVNTSYDITPDLKVYATYSEGFRHGGNSEYPLSGAFASVPSLAYLKPDLAKNYEVGVKGSFLDRRITYFADVYRMDTTDFQIDVANLGGGWGALNGSESRAQGVEMQLDAAVTSQLRASLGYAFTHSYVLKSFDVQDYVPFALIPSLGGTGQTASLFGGPIPAGTPMPGISKNVVNALLEYTIPTGDWNWRLHLDGSYRSPQNSNLVPGSFYEFKIPSVVMANASVTLFNSGPLNYQFFVRNITNNPDITGGENDQLFANPDRLREVGMPRTIGLGLRYKF